MYILGGGITPDDRLNVLDATIKVTVISVDTRISYSDGVTTPIQSNDEVIRDIVGPHMTHCNVVVNAEDRFETHP